MTNGERIWIAIASYTARSGRAPRAELAALLEEVGELAEMPAHEGDRLIVEAIVIEMCWILVARVPDRITETYALRDRLRDQLAAAGVARG